MCNDYANHVPWSVYVEAFSETRLPVAGHIESRHADIAFRPSCARDTRIEADGVFAIALRWDVGPRALLAG
jgi:hypothetical protein